MSEFCGLVSLAVNAIGIYTFIQIQHYHAKCKVFKGLQCKVEIMNLCGVFCVSSFHNVNCPAV